MIVEMNQIIGGMGRFIWPFFRVSTLFLAAPIFGAKVVPKKIRLFTAIAVTLMIVPTINFVPNYHEVNFDMVMLVGMQVVIGLSIALVMQLLFQIFVLAGQLMAMQTGLGFAQQMDPQNGVSVPVVSQFYMVVVTLLFLSMNGHLLLIQIIKDSFTFMPLTLFPMNDDYFYQIALRLAWLFSSSLLVALPVVVAIFMVNIAFAVMTRAAPQLNIFTLGFPITILIGISMMLLGLSIIPWQFDQYYHAVSSFILHLMEAQNGG